MKKFFMTAVMAAVAFTASAQVEQGIRYGVIAGGNLTNVTDVDDSKSLFGYKGGAVLEYNLSEKLYLGSGLEYTTKGFKHDAIDGDVNSGYLQLPINIGGRMAISDGSYIFGQVGPYVAFAIAPAEIDWYGGGTSKAESFDWGFNARVGLEFNKIQIFAGYELGMQEAFDTSDGTKNRVFNFGLAYMF